MSVQSLQTHQEEQHETVRPALGACGRDPFLHGAQPPVALAPGGEKEGSPWSVLVGSAGT